MDNQGRQHRAPDGRQGPSDVDQRGRCGSQSVALETVQTEWGADRSRNECDSGLFDVERQSVIYARRIMVASESTYPLPNGNEAMDTPTLALLERVRDFAMPYGLLQCQQVFLCQVGEIRMAPDEAWLPFTAEQTPQSPRFQLLHGRLTASSANQHTSV